jgi:hypothetical protein
MMLVLSCHAYVLVLCSSIIRIALRLLLSSVAMFCIGPVPSLFLLAVTLIVYRTCQVDGTNNPSSRDRQSSHAFCFPREYIMSDKSFLRRQIRA